ncbi:MAG: antibiotic biosynthesis monooxygenase [Lentisphaerae bacterium]|jgi:quinol monooxygenase YgiN|nr:antibiotic biosynthesis monooxygenase [Lentisphaerota bacterium]
MIHLVVTIQVKPDCREAFLDHFTRLRPTVLAEEGCVQYQLFADLPGGTNPPDPDTFTLLEQWESEAHLKTHLAAPHMKAYSQAVGPLRVSTTLRILRALP